MLLLGSIPDFTPKIVLIVAVIPIMFNLKFYTVVSVKYIKAASYILLPLYGKRPWILLDV
ncbi:MAG TPA: hypothetical protein DCQ99_00435 [Nitrospinae bacterium]|nr:hypothetical protein [Nitrospinota bacterium]